MVNESNIAKKSTNGGQPTQAEENTTLKIIERNIKGVIVKCDPDTACTASIIALSMTERNKIALNQTTTFITLADGTTKKSEGRTSTSYLLGK